jgi:hypothetical protein
MERHGLSSPTATVDRTPTGELSSMAFLVGVNLRRTRPDTPTRCVQRLRSAVACASRSAMADLNRGRISLPPPGGGEGRRAEYSALSPGVRSVPYCLHSGPTRKSIVDVAVDDKPEAAQGTARDEIRAAWDHGDWIGQAVSRAAVDSQKFAPLHFRTYRAISATNLMRHIDFSCVASYIPHHSSSLHSLQCGAFFGAFWCLAYPSPMPRSEP